MAHLWTQDAQGWSARRLVGCCVHLPLACVDASGTPASDPREPCAVILRAGEKASPLWAIAADDDSAVRVNGESPVAGLRILNDRDLIRTGEGEQYYFSTEVLAQIEPFPGSERPVFCGRCRQAIEAGALAVRCPGCGVWYNQSPELPCWTYSEKCAFCGAASDLEKGFEWTPED